MPAVAVACALLPGALWQPLASSFANKSVRLLAQLFALAWLGLAVVNIRVTLPLWSDEIRLWTWVLRKYPQSIEAKDHLLSTYLERNDRTHARQLADILLAEKQPCTTCMINIASLAVADRDTTRAEEALVRARDSMHAGIAPRSMQAYVLATGQLLELQGDLDGAETAYRGAISLEPLDPRSQMALALLLAREGKVDEARRQAAIAVPLLAPDEREAGRSAFESTLQAPTSSLPRPAAPVR